MTESSGILKLPSVLDASFLQSCQEIERQIHKNSRDQLVEEEVQTSIYPDSSMQCINCLNRIPSDSIEMHKSVCSAFGEISISSEGALELNQSQVSKFSKYLENLLKNKSLEPYHSAVIEELLKCSETLKYNKTDSAAAFELQKFLNSLWNLHKANLSLGVVIKRLSSIVQTHINILLSISATQRKSKLIDMKKKVRRLRKTKVFSKDKSEIKIDKKKIELINKQIKHKRTNSNYFPNDVPTKTKHSRTLSQVQLDESQLSFYGICLQIKMQRDLFSPSQTVSIPSLYEMANKQNISPDDWPQFISEQLANPSNRKPPPIAKVPSIKGLDEYTFNNNKH